MIKTLLIATGYIGLSASAANAAIIADFTNASGVTLDFGGEPPLADMLKNNSSPDGTTVTLKGSPSNRLVDYIALAGETLETAGNGNGFATVTEQGNGGNDTGFAGLRIDPQGAIGFSKINFNLEPRGSGNFSWYADITLKRLDGGADILFNDVLFTQGENKFAISSATNILFESITFANLANGIDGAQGRALQKFDSMRHVSVQFGQLTAPVPEPATWAMMLVGFGVVGASLRRRPARALQAA